MLSHLKLRGVEGVRKVFMWGGAMRIVWDDETGFGVKNEW